MKILCWIDLPQTLWPRGLTWLQPGSWSLRKDFCEFSVSGAPMLLCTYSVTPVGPQSAFQPPRSWMTGPAQAFFLSFLFFFLCFYCNPQKFPCLQHTLAWWPLRIQVELVFVPMTRMQPSTLLLLRVWRWSLLFFEADFIRRLIQLKDGNTDFPLKLFVSLWEF